MSDTFYRAVRMVGRVIFWMTSRPVVVGAGRVPRAGACIIAATHQSAYDVALLIRHNDRLLDFVSIVEVFRKPLVGWFYGSLNAFPLDRSRPDAPTVRTILTRLKKGRVVAMFPEGGFRTGTASVVHTRRIRPGIGRIARIAGAPVVPCVIVDSVVYARAVSWLPLRRTRYGVIFGEPLASTLEPMVLETALVEAFVSLHAELGRVMRGG